MEVLGSVATWFLVFLVYSFVGWLMEVAISIFISKNRKPSNRGFLIGPLCPIYGVGALIMTFLLRDTHNIVEVFVVAAVSSAILEYCTSFVMERLFRVRWWDYHHERFNLNGRVCLKMILVFGLMGVIVTQVTNPVLLEFINNINETVRVIIAAVLLVILLTDLAVTLWLIVGCRVTAGVLQTDATSEISANIRDILMGQGKLRRRLAKAFPSMEVKQKKTPARKKAARK